jgi:hypothetical protein
MSAMFHNRVLEIEMSHSKTHIINVFTNDERLHGKCQAALACADGLCPDLAEVMAGATVNNCSL